MDRETVVTTEEVHPTTGTAAVRRTTTTSAGRMNDFFVLKTNQVIFTIIGIIDLLILIRFFLLLLGANRVGVVTFIINLTDIFVAPAAGIFPSQVVEGSYFEPASIVAIIMWLVIGFIIGAIVSLLSTSTESDALV